MSFVFASRVLLTKLSYLLVSTYITVSNTVPYIIMYDYVCIIMYLYIVNGLFCVTKSYTASEITKSVTL